MEDKTVSKGNRIERCGLDASGAEQGQVPGSCEHANEPLGSLKGVEFVDQMSDCFPIRTLFHGVS